MHENCFVIVYDVGHGRLVAISVAVTGRTTIVLYPGDTRKSIPENGQPLIVR